MWRSSVRVPECLGFVLGVGATREFTEKCQAFIFQNINQPHARRIKGLDGHFLEQSIKFEPLALRSRFTLRQADLQDQSFAIGAGDFAESSAVLLAAQAI